MTFHPSRLRDSLRRPAPPPQPPPETPDGSDPLPKLVTLRIEWPNGAVREYTAHNPLGFQQAIAASGEIAGLPPGFRAEDAKEPVVAVMFSGNPAAGGIQVSASGKL